MHKIDQCENDVGKSSAGVSWLDETIEVEIMGEKPTVAPTFKPTKPPPVQKPTQGPVQQKPTQGPVQQKPTQGPVKQQPPVYLKPTQAPSKKLKPTIAPPRKLKPTQAPVEQKPTQAPVEQKPTQGPIQQKPTQGPVQQKPTQAPVEQKPTQAPVQQKPTESPVQKKPTQAPVEQKPTQGPVQQKPTQGPVQQKPTQGPVQQKPTQGPVEQKPTQGPVQQKPIQAPKIEYPVQELPIEYLPPVQQQKPTQGPVEQKPTQAPVEQVKPTQAPLKDYPKQELPVEYMPPAQQRPTQGPIQQKPIQVPWRQTKPTQAPVEQVKPTQAPVQQKPTQAPKQTKPTQAPWQQMPWQQHPQQEWSDDLWAGEDKYVDLPPYSDEFDQRMHWDKAPYANLPEEFEEDQLRRPKQKQGSWSDQQWQKPFPVDLAILRDDLSWQAKAIDYYFKTAEELNDSYGEFFQNKGKEEVRCFKQVLNLFNSLNDVGYGKIPQQSLEEFLDWETGSKYWDDYLDDGLPGSKESGQKQKQSDARQRPRGGFFCPPGGYPRSRMVNKPKVRACLTGAVQMVAEAITIYEEQIRHLGHPVARNLLVRILMHEKEVLAELTEKLLEVLPKES